MDRFNQKQMPHIGANSWHLKRARSWLADADKAKTPLEQVCSIRAAMVHLEALLTANSHGA